MLKNKTIGFIGLGVMGSSMAEHILNAGYELHVYTRTKKKAEHILSQGAQWEDSVKALAEASDIVITIIGTPEDVRDVYLGDSGLLHYLKPGSYAIDMTTSSPKLAEEIFNEAKKSHVSALDAPVSGGDVGAKNGTLAIMVGGEKDVFNKMFPLFELMGGNIVLQGEAGAGQHTKMVNQITIAPGMIGVCEALIYADAAGLDSESVLSSIATGAAGSWSLSNYGPRIIENDFEPGFAIKHYIKDMKIARASAKEMGLKTPGLDLAFEMYEEVAAKGLLEKGTHALMKYYQN